MPSPGSPTHRPEARHLQIETKVRAVVRDDLAMEIPLIP
jgi:hypothetical protein